MEDSKCVMPNYEEELKIRCAEMKELKQSYDRLFDENSKLGLMYEKSLKEKDELELKIRFLEG